MRGTVEEMKRRYAVLATLDQRWKQLANQPQAATQLPPEIWSHILRYRSMEMAKDARAKKAIADKIWEERQFYADMQRRLDLLTDIPSLTDEEVAQEFNEPELVQRYNELLKPIPEPTQEEIFIEAVKTRIEQGEEIVNRQLADFVDQIKQINTDTNQSIENVMNNHNELRNAFNKNAEIRYEDIKALVANQKELQEQVIKLTKLREEDIARLNANDQEIVTKLNELVAPAAPAVQTRPVSQGTQYVTPPNPRKRSAAPYTGPLKQARVSPPSIPSTVSGSSRAPSVPSESGSASTTASADSDLNRLVVTELTKLKQRNGTSTTQTAIQHVLDGVGKAYRENTRVNHKAIMQTLLAVLASHPSDDLAEFIVGFNKVKKGRKQNEWKSTQRKKPGKQSKTKVNPPGIMKKYTTQ